MPPKGRNYLVSVNPVRDFTFDSHPGWKLLSAELWPAPWWKPWAADRIIMVMENATGHASAGAKSGPQRVGKNGNGAGK